MREPLRGSAQAVQAAASPTLVERVVFRVGGEQVVGNLHRPRADRPVPGLIVGGPMTSVKEQVTGLYAAALARRGFAALAIDHRHFGESEGEPRQYEVHHRKREDLLAATEYLASRPEVDSCRLAGLGICLGAGYVASVVAVEPRLRAFVGVAGYYRDPADMRAADPAGFDARVEQGRQARLIHEATGRTLLIPAASTQGDAAMQTADTVDYYTRRCAVASYVNAFAVMSREHFLPFDVQALAPKIAVPALLVHSEHALAPRWARRFHQALAGPKPMVWVRSSGQTDFYDAPGLVEQVVHCASAFLE